MITSENLIFPVTVIVVFFLSNQFITVLMPKLEGSRLFSTIFTLFLGVLILFALFRRKMIQYDAFHFEVTPEKKCQGYPYMQTSDPELSKYCNNLFSTSEGRGKFEMVNCDRGFAGRPLHFERDEMSNDKWKNKMCNKLSETRLSVL